MRRIKLVLAVGVLMAMLLSMVASPALANINFGRDHNRGFDVLDNNRDDVLDDILDNNLDFDFLDNGVISDCDFEGFRDRGDEALFSCDVDSGFDSGFVFG